LLASGKIDAVIETDINIWISPRAWHYQGGRRPLHGNERRTDYAQIEHRVGEQRTDAPPGIGSIGLIGSAGPIDALE